MLAVVSPAKSLDFSENELSTHFSHPVFLSTSRKLVKSLKNLSESDLMKLMGISEKLAATNKERFENFKTPFTPKNSKPAIFAFTGDVYKGFNVQSLNDKDLNYAQDHLRILSGLYGILKPLDLIQAYRLEMGTKFSLGKNQDLYDLWKEKTTLKLNEELEHNKALVNLASEEYFKSIDQPKLIRPVITPVFKEERNGKLKIISFNAKKARGLMANYIVKNKVKTATKLKAFSLDGYRFQSDLSSDTELIFTR